MMVFNPIEAPVSTTAAAKHLRPVRAGPYANGGPMVQGVFFQAFGTNPFVVKNLGRVALPADEYGFGGSVHSPSFGTNIILS